MSENVVPPTGLKRRRVCLDGPKAATQEKLHKFSQVVKNIVIRELWKDGSITANSLGEGFVFDCNTNSLTVDGMVITVEVISYATEETDASQSEASSRSGEDDKSMEYI